MPAGTELSQVVIAWSDEGLDFGIEVGQDGMARLTRLTVPRVVPESPDAPPVVPGTPAMSAVVPGSPAAPPVVSSAVPAFTDAALPLLDVVLAGEGKAWSGSRYCESQAGGRFRYAGHDEGAAGQPWRELRVDLDDATTGLRAEVFFRVLAGSGALRSWVRLTNFGSEPVTVQSVTSFLCGGLAGATGPEGLGGPEALEDLDVLWAESDWLAESRWQRRPLRDALPDLNRRVHGGDPRGRFGLTSSGTWSSGTFLPMGAVVSRRTGHAWAWQIEHNGGWHWQVGECTHRSVADGADLGGRHAPPGAVTGAYIALLGPADAEHHWQASLNPGDSFTTVPVSVVVSAAEFEGAVAGLTAVRRAIRRPHEDSQRLPVIFNDYMNTLMGNPTTERLLPLVTAAAEAGAEYFCIDSGWYTDTGGGWWKTVGAWKPSGSRFPNGIAEVLDHIRAAGMVPGLWLEPEVVGVNSPVARQLPPEAFFQRDGRLIAEHGRYHLDLRHPAVVKHLDEVVDFLVGDLGVGYFKLDYNINVGPGPDAGGLSPGAGLLAANRAHLDWLDGVLDRHPGLVIENCSSGGSRVDYALLSRLQLQSTSDQQDYLRYPPIAAAAPAAMVPEQAANWAYPQPSFTDDEIAFTLCTTLLGRMYLSGHLDKMNSGQRELVAAAVRVHKSIRVRLPGALPFWPLGLPRWTDSWIALGMRAPATPGAPATREVPGSREVPGNPEVNYLTVWHRGALDGTRANTGTAVHADPTEVVLPLKHLRGQQAVAEVLYPAQGRAEVTWSDDSGELTVALAAIPTACLIRLTPGG